MQAVKRVLPIMAIIALSLMLSSSAYAAIQKGYVKDQYGNAVVGAHVVNTRQTDPSGQATSHAITNNQGYYEVYAQDWSGSNTFVTYKDDYTTPFRWNDFWSNPDEGSTNMDWTLNRLYAGHTVYDTFNDPEGNPIGRPTQDSRQQKWAGTSSAGIINGELVLSNGEFIIGPNTDGIPFLPGDFDLTCRMRFDGYGPASIVYRRDPTGVGGWTSFYNDGMNWIIEDGDGITSPPIIVRPQATVPHDWSQYLDIRIKAQGYHKQIWLNDLEVVNHLTIDTSYDTSLPEPTVKGGDIGFFAGTGTTMYVDSIYVTELTTVPEPGSLATLLAGTAGLIGLIKRGKYHASR